MKRAIALILSLLLMVLALGAVGIVRAEETDADFFATILSLEEEISLYIPRFQALFQQP